MKQFKRHKDYGFFDQDIHLTKLPKLGDSLERLLQGIYFELFRSIWLLRKVQKRFRLQTKFDVCLNRMQRFYGNGILFYEASGFPPSFNFFCT
jgi:hypothetical protein